MSSETTCPQCGVANPAAAQFCMACGASLARSCPSCGAEAPPQARFCMACGTAFEDAAATTAPAPAAAAAAQAELSEERRTVSVLFADISGYTAVAERLDHET